MPRYYCDYCDTYLTHDSPSVRKQHNAGYKHKANVRTYYQQFEAQQSQSFIDQKVKEYAGQYQQVGAVYNQARVRLPVLAPPMLQIGVNPQLAMNPQLLQQFRPPPVLARPPPGTQGYVLAPSTPPLVGPPGAPSFTGQVNGLPRPPTLNPPTMVPGSTMAPTSSGSTSVVTPVMYQANPQGPTSTSFESFNMNAEPTEPNH